MSAASLQRVVVRMLHDGAFAEAVAAGAEVPELTEVERQWVRSVDPRRWRADPMRRYRTLQTLLEEYPAASALAVREAGLPAVDAFLSSPIFHHTLQNRGRLALAFGPWLAAGFSPQVGALALLEAALAQSRRPMPPLNLPAGHLVRAPGVVALAPPSGTLAHWQAVMARLDAHREGRLAAVADAQWRLAAGQPGAASEGLLVEPGPRIGEAALELVTFLAGLSEPTSRPAASVALAALGAEGSEGSELIDELCIDGILVRGNSEGYGTT